MNKVTVMARRPPHPSDMYELDYRMDSADPNSFQSDKLDVWRIDLRAEGSLDIEDSLSGDEIERAGAYRRRIDADHFVAARRGLRRVLGMYLGIRSDEVRFVYNEFGKPELDTKYHRNRFHFNMSRSGAIVIIVVSRYSAVGVDIEFIDPKFPFFSVAEKYFPPSVANKLRQLPADAARSLFFDVWTKIEAYGKGMGGGLSTAVCLNCLKFGIPTTGDVGSQQLVRTEDWSVFNVFAGHNYAAAIAAKGDANCVQYWDAVPSQRAQWIRKSRRLQRRVATI